MPSHAASGPGPPWEDLDRHARQPGGVDDDQPLDARKVPLEWLEPLFRQAPRRAAGPCLRWSRDGARSGGPCDNSCFLLRPASTPCRSRGGGPRPGHRNGPAGRPNGPPSCRSSRGGPSPRGWPSSPRRATPVGWPGAVLLLELTLEVEKLAADAARLPPEFVEGLFLFLGQRPGAEQPVDPLIDGLALAEQPGLAVALLGSERSCRPAGQFIGDAAGQAALPARPRLARPGRSARARAAARPGSGEPIPSATSSPLGPSERACS